MKAVFLSLVKRSPEFSFHYQHQIFARYVFFALLKISIVNKRFKLSRFVARRKKVTLTDGAEIVEAQLQLFLSASLFSFH